MHFRTILAASAAVIISAAAAQAAEVAALTGDNTISIVDTSKKAVTKTWKIQGVTGKVVGIDVRPADGMMYAVGAEGGIYTVDMGPAAPLRRGLLPQHAGGRCPECHGLGRVYDATEGRWCPTIRSPSASARSRPGRRRGRARTCATSSSRWATTSTGPGATCRRRTATGSCSPTSSRRCRSTPGSRRRRRGAALKRKEEPSYHGHLHQRPALRAADLRHDARAR